LHTAKKKLFTGKMNLELKKRTLKCLVWSVAHVKYAADVDVDADRQKNIRSL